MNKPDSAQIQFIIRYVYGTNERMEAPLIRFLLNYYSVDQIKKKMNTTKKRILSLFDKYQNYYIIQFNQKTKKIEVFSYLKHKVENSF